MTKKGTCSTCVEKQKELPNYCCVLCSLGLTKENQYVDEHGTVHIDWSDLFPVKAQEDGYKRN